MPYSQYTQTQFAQEVAAALGDSGNVYWAVDEINRALNEALLYWGALTNYWRERGQFQTTALQPLYDLSTVFPTLRTRAYTIGQLTTEIQYHLFEPATGTAGTGMTSQFTIGQITAALVRERNQLVLDTRIPFTFTTGSDFAVAPTANGRASLPDSVALITHAWWKDGFTGLATTLRREDGYSEDSYNPLWTLSPGLPFAYSTAETRPVEIQLYPINSSAGSFGAVYTKTLNLAVANNTSFAVPDEFAFAIKYRALNSLLATNNEGFDPLRADYALERYRQAVAVSDGKRSVLRVQVNNVPVALDTLANLPSLLPTWMTSYGSPNLSACAYDVLALAPVPNAQLGVSCDVVRSAPLPAAGGDFIQVGREDIPYLFDYVRHILSFKLGGAEFQATMPLYDNFIAGATQRNKLLVSKVRYLTPLFTKPAQQESEVPAA